MDSLYDYGEEEHDFYEETPGIRKGYPIDHRSLKVRAFFFVINCKKKNLIAFDDAHG